MAVLVTSYHIFVSAMGLGGNLEEKSFGVILCDSGIRITWVLVSRLPMLHPERDRWKHTMFH